MEKIKLSCPSWGLGARVGIVVKALRYKLAGHGFDSKGFKKLIHEKRGVV